MMQPISDISMSLYSSASIAENPMLPAGVLCQVSFFSFDCSACLLRALIPLSINLMTLSAALLSDWVLSL
jgi:hypothetical protein